MNLLNAPFCKVEFAIARIYNNVGMHSSNSSSNIEENRNDCLLAFWDGKSHGTKYTIDYAMPR